MSTVPRVNIPITKITPAGVAPPSQVNSDAANDHYFVNDGGVYLEVVSTDAGAQNVTIPTPAVTGGQTIQDRVVSIPAGATRLIGPFPPALYSQPDGTVFVDVGVSTTLKFRAYKVY